MSILVTGANGFLGRAVVERLCGRKIPKVRCFVRPRSDHSRLDALQVEYPNCKLEYVVGNLTSPADCRRALDGITTVFHLAAQMKGAPASLFLNTVVASNRIIEAMLQSGPKRVVLVSSLAVYGPMYDGARPVLDEATPLERRPQKRDVYAQTKLWQESLFRQLRAENGYELVVLRPGVIYGQGGQEFSPRMGMKVGNWLWRFGRNNLLPLTYVQNCAEAVVMAGLEPGLTGCYNVIDDDLPTAGKYLREYRRRVGQIRSIWIPWWLTRGLSRAVEAYSNFSHGQLPPVLTPYKSAVMWRGSRFDNSKLKRLGWRQVVSTPEALQLTFEYFKQDAETMTSVSMGSETRASSLGAPAISYDI
jgi:nucleoside-diphosphate-sugar epimerase